MKLLPWPIFFLLLALSSVSFALPPLTGAGHAAPVQRAVDIAPATVSSSTTAASAPETIEPATSTSSALSPGDKIEPLLTEVEAGSDLAQLHSDFIAQFRRAQPEQVKRVLSLPRHPDATSAAYKQMRNTYERLYQPDVQPEELSTLLEKINALRRDGYRFNIETDPGLHVRRGRPWEWWDYGPYPARRLALVELKERVGSETWKQKVRQELENAERALDAQSLLDMQRLGNEERRLVYTDDEDLLRSAVEYYRAKLAWVARARV